MGFHTLHPHKFLLTCALFLALTACGGGGGGGGGSSPEVPEENTPADSEPVSRLFIASNPQDQYYGSYLQGDASLTLLGGSSMPNDLESAIVYQDEDGAVELNLDSSGNQSLVIGGYQFSVISTGSGSTIEVTDPDGNTESYDFDVNGDPVTPADPGSDPDPEPDPDPIAAGIDSSCIAYTDTVSFCMNLDSGLFPASYCTLEAINTTGGGQGIFTSVSYSTEQLCAERGYPYQADNTVQEGWSAWYQDPVSPSLLVSKAQRASRTDAVITPLASDDTFGSQNPFDTSACNDQMYSQENQWETCMEQMLLQFKALAKIGFSKEVAYLIDTYYRSLKPAWERFKQFTDEFSAADSIDEVLATGAQFAANLADNASRFASNVVSGISALFEDKSSGELADSYTGFDDIDDLPGQIWDGANSTLEQPAPEPTAPATTYSCVATAALSSYCMDLDPAHYAADYCSLDSLNSVGGGEGQILGVSLSEDELCADRGYTHNLSCNNQTGWSAWYRDPVSDNCDDSGNSGSDATGVVPAAAEVTCSTMGRYFDLASEHAYIECEGRDSAGELVFELTEYMGPHGGAGNHWEYEVILTIHQGEVAGTREAYRFQHMEKQVEDSYNNTVRSYGAWSTSTGNQLFYDEGIFTSYPDRNLLAFRLNDDGYVGCSDATPSYAGDWVVSSAAKYEYGQACPYEKSADSTQVANDITIDSMWLKTGKYKQYLVD